MAVIINDPYSTGTSEEAGKNFGDILKTGLEGLAHHKMSQLTREKQAGVLRELGLNPAIAHLPEKIQQGILENQLVEQPKKQMQFQRQQQQIAQKETLPYFTETYKGYKSAEDSDKRLDKMTELIKKGKLSNPLFASGIKFAGKLGADLGSLMNADSQQFEKLSNDFVRDAKSIFGSRLTDADLNAFLRTVPTLTQSDEAKGRLIDTLRQINQAAKIKYRATKDIIRQNGGKRPANLETIVQEVTQPEIDQIAANFKSSFGI